MASFNDVVKALLPARERARVEAYLLHDCGHGTDIFGAAPGQLPVAYALAYYLHRHYFRVVSAGHDNIPKRGAGVVVGNHSGVLPFDAMMMSTDVFRHSDPPRLMRYMVDYFVYEVPFLNVWFRSLGQVPGTRRNFDGLIEEGHLVGIFPEGAKALGKPAAERYQLLPFSHGHVELAARHGIPVVPFGVVGAEEQQTMIANIKPLAQAFHLPFVPITRTFPLLGPVGLLPKPSRYYIHYGSPIEVDPDALTSLSVRAREAERVQEAVAEQIQVGLKQRERQERISA